MSLIAAAVVAALLQAAPDAPLNQQVDDTVFTFDDQETVYVPTAPSLIGLGQPGNPAGAVPQYGLHDQASVFVHFGPSPGSAAPGASGAWVTSATAMSADISAMRSRVLVKRFGDSLALRNQTIEDCGDVNVGGIVTDRITGSAETNVVLSNVNFIRTGRCER